MDVEFRFNIVLKIFAELVWYTMQLTVFEVLFLHADHISGWTVHDMRVFMGCLFLSDVLYMIFMHDSMDSIFKYVRDGSLDLYISKPVNSQFMVSTRKVSTTHILNFFMILGYLSWAINQLDHNISFLELVGFAVLLISGFITMYSLRFLFATIPVFTQDAGNINMIWYQLYRLGTRPDPIYPSALRTFVLMVFPMAFFASVPSRLLVEGFNLRLFIAAPLLAMALLFFSNWVWERALKHYASASS